MHDLGHRLGVASGMQKTFVRLGQSGRMRQETTSRWIAFRAEQTISNDACAFEWRARTGPFGIISVCDALTADGGKLDVRALGVLRLASLKNSPELMRGELIRYLAELAWAPAAILMNRELRWREDGPGRLVVSAGSGETSAEVALTLDSEGRIASAFAPDRPRAVKATMLPTPWQGYFSDYRRHETMWLPFAGRVGWTIDGREEIYWEGKLEHWTTKGSDVPLAAGMRRG